MSASPPDESQAISLYIYYRVDPACAADGACLPAARERLAAVAAPHCERFLLLRRADDPSTWMEVLESVGDVPAALMALEQAWARLPLSSYVDKAGTRHVERFHP